MSNLKICFLKERGYTVINSKPCHVCRGKGIIEGYLYGVWINQDASFYTCQRCLGSGKYFDDPLEAYIFTHPEAERIAEELADEARSYDNWFSKTIEQDKEDYFSE